MYQMMGMTGQPSHQQQQAAAVAQHQATVSSASISSSFIARKSQVN